MRVRYSHWDESITQQMTLKNLMKLFTHLLTQSAGDVEKALKWMEYLGRRYGFFDENFTMENFKEYLHDQNYVRSNDQTQRFELTDKGEQKIRTDAFEEIFASLKRDNIGGSHRTNYSGEGGEKLPETRRFQFGDMVNDIDFTRSIQNAVRKHGLEEFTMEEDDLEVNHREQATSCATMMLVDISHSMILYGEDRITPAKKVAMALAEFIQTRYPKDTLEVGLFGDDAQLVSLRDLPYISVGPFHTNTKAGLELAQKVLNSKRQVNKQIFMITDGKPSAIFEGGMIYKNPFGLDPKIVNQTINEAVQCRRKGIVITTFMLTSDPYLKDFVDKLTKANKGRAYYASLDNLGSFIFTDYVRNRKKRV
ncbi:MAG: vWA domain-containing protein [Candidatus Sumerlaeaceae bacterium]